MRYGDDADETADDDDDDADDEEEKCWLADVDIDADVGAVIQFDDNTLWSSAISATFKRLSGP